MHNNLLSRNGLQFRSAVLCSINPRLADPRTLLYLVKSNVKLSDGGPPKASTCATYETRLLMPSLLLCSNSKYKTRSTSLIGDCSAPCTISSQWQDHQHYYHLKSQHTRRIDSHKFIRTFSIHKIKFIMQKLLQRPTLFVTTGQETLLSCDTEIFRKCFLIVIWTNFTYNSNWQESKILKGESPFLRLQQPSTRSPEEVLVSPRCIQWCRYSSPLFRSLNNGRW